MVRLNYSEKQEEQMKKAKEYFAIHKENITTHTLSSYFQKFFKNNIHTYYIPRIRRLIASKPGVQLKRFILLYGKIEGYKKFKNYGKNRAVINSFEYKNKTKGWSKEEYDAYNKSRAITLENMIKRHGEEEGTKKFKNYCERQSYAGVKLEYFIEKYGKEEGEKIYKEMVLSKMLYKDTFIRKYGIIEGNKKYQELLDKLKVGVISNVSNKFCEELYQKLPTHLQSYCCYNSLNKEYGIYEPKLSKYFLYDFVITNIKFCIEFNGDFWHANPKAYKPNEILNLKGGKKLAKEIWEKDRIKKDTIEKQGYKLISIWESDYLEFPEETLEQALLEISNREKELKGE